MFLIKYIFLYWEKKIKMNNSQLKNKKKYNKITDIPSFKYFYDNNIKIDRQSEIISILNLQLSQNKDKIDYDLIRHIGQNYGFINKEFREQCWALLLDIDTNKIQNSKDYRNWYDGENKSKQYDQLNKDVDRSLTYLKIFEKCSEDTIKQYKIKLLTILDGIMQKQEELNYYQGYHDISTIILLTFSIDIGYRVSKKAANSFFKDNLVYKFDQSVMQQLEIIMILIKKENNVLGGLFEQLGQPMFCVPWLLTWFAHSLSDYDQIQRIYDYLLSSESYSIIYLCASFVLTTKDQLMEAVKEESEGAEIGVIFTFYQNIKCISIDWEEVFQKAIWLEKKYCIEELTQQLINNSQLPKDSIIITKNFDKLLTYRNKLQVKNKYQYEQERQLKNKQSNTFKKIINLIYNKKYTVLVTVSSILIFYASYKYQFKKKEIF